METVVTVRVPAIEFALSTTFEALPDVEAEVDPLIESGDETVLPVVRLRGADRDVLGEFLRVDPSVEHLSPLSHRGDGDAPAYRVDWSDDAHRALETFTAANGRVLGIRSQDGHWRIQVLYSDREHLLEAYEHWTEQGVTVDIEHIRGIDGHPSTDASVSET